MAVLELFSTRQKRQRGEVPEVYSYDDLANPLRVQIVHLWREGFGRVTEEAYGVIGPVQQAFREIHLMLCKEFGVFNLTEDGQGDAFAAVANYFLHCSNVERALDIVELAFAYLITSNHSDRFSYTSEATPQEVVQELNTRFKQHGAGYVFDSSTLKIMRVDSEFLHSETVKPALVLLSQKRFHVPNEEFTKAHQHYRERRYSECIADCLKTFESTMKVICSSHRWNYAATDTAKALIKVCFDHGLIPSYLESELAALRAILESGLPTVRNKTSGHGHGTKAIAIPPHLASFALHITAANIVFLAECEKQLR